MMKTKLLRTGLAAAVAMLFAQGAAAQEIIPFQVSQETNLVGLGVFSIPDWYGSKDRKTRLGPLLHYNIQNNMYVQIVGPELRANVLPNTLTGTNEWRAGPVIRARQRRDDGVEDGVVKRMTPVAAAVEVGIFAQYHMPMEPGRPLHKIVFAADVVGNTNNVYSGATGNIKATYYYPFAGGLGGKPLLGTLGFGLFFASDHFVRKYFGVNNQDIINLPEFADLREEKGLSGGLASIKIPFSLTSQIDPKWLVTVAGRYERLINDAEDNPLVKRRGDENQWTIGVAASYLF